MTGEVLLDGEDVLTMRPGRLRAVRWEEMSIVFQGALHTLNPVRRIGWQIEEAITLHRPSIAKREVRARVAELLDVVGIPGSASRPTTRTSSPAARSSGCSSPSRWPATRALLIADEPTTALDVMVQAQVLRLLEELQRDLGLAMLFITHDLSTLASVVPAPGGHVRRAARRGGGGSRRLRRARPTRTRWRWRRRFP